jgi:hypothetical protein
MRRLGLLGVLLLLGVAWSQKPRVILIVRDGTGPAVYPLDHPGPKVV